MYDLLTNVYIRFAYATKIIFLYVIKIISNWYCVQIRQKAIQNYEGAIYLGRPPKSQIFRPPPPVRVCPNFQNHPLRIFNNFWEYK